VVKDNCSIHKDEEIQRLIEAAGARLVYLPPAHRTSPCLKTGRQLMASRAITIDKEVLNLFLKTIVNDLQKLTTGIAILDIAREDA